MTHTRLRNIHGLIRAPAPVPLDVTRFDFAYFDKFDKMANQGGFAACDAKTIPASEIQQEAALQGVDFVPFIDVHPNLFVPRQFLSRIVRQRGNIEERVLFSSLGEFRQIRVEDRLLRCAPSIPNDFTQALLGLGGVIGSLIPALPLIAPTITAAAGAGGLTTQIVTPAPIFIDEPVAQPATTRTIALVAGLVLGGVLLFSLR